MPEFRQTLFYGEAAADHPRGAAAGLSEYCCSADRAPSRADTPVRQGVATQAALTSRFARTSFLLYPFATANSGVMLRA